MKKVLSIFLAVLMICSCMALATSAADSKYFGDTWGEKVATKDQAIFLFRLQGGKCKNGHTIYDGGQKVWKDAEEVPDVFMLVPENAGDFKLGNLITLPSVKAQKGRDFVGWQRVPTTDSGDQSEEDVEPDTDNHVYSSMAGQYKVQKADLGKIVEFMAIYEEGEFEQDTFSKVFEILIKVFGTLLGLITGGSIQAGQDTVRQLFASISG